MPEHLVYTACSLVLLFKPNGKQFASEPINITIFVKTLAGKRFELREKLSA